MRVFVTLLAFASLPAAAQDCLGESEAFFSIVAAKWAVNEGIEKDPESFEGEKWLYILGASESAFEERKISEARAQSMARLVAENDYSDNPEVEVNIFEDYWFLSCEVDKEGGAAVPLGDIEKGSLLECWNTVASREEFQACLLPLVKKS